MRIQPKKIMCAIDFSDYSHHILSYGRALASEFEATLYVCHILPDMVMLSSHGQAYIASNKLAEERLENAKSALGDLIKKHGLNAQTIVSQGHAADEITQIVRKKNIELVIAATHGGSGIKRFLIGSVTDRLVKTLTCPLLVLRAQENHPSFPDVFRVPLERILVGCDFSPESGLAFEYGLSLAQEFQAELHLVHVIKPEKHIELTTSDYMKIQEGDFLGWNRSDFLALQQKATDEEWERRSRFLSRIERQLSQMVPEESRNWCTPVTALLEGQAYAELIQYAQIKKIDMMVLGIHGHSLLEQFLVGSTTDRVISRSTCPVLAVRKPA
ncbi:MAG: universal stress protein [Proteobacteria bacterium]|nr:universal stress protein [Desulfobacula sp.]MBU3951054.1 universal stress protein [Pseudomonadota bacterium]MBU4132762.1 universal stress protein [Pseudomonadota bacterium]